MSTETAKKILVVDDEKDLREALSTALSYEGFTVGMAEDGVEGYTKAHEMKPDIILLDILMPKQDGIATLKAIKKEEWGKGMTIIMMTAVDDMGRVAEALEAGASEYLVKSDISLSSIVAKVKEKFA